MPVIKVTSHRSQERLERALTLGRQQYRWTPRGAEAGFYVIDMADLPIALAIKGVRECKRINVTELRNTWGR